MPKLKSGSKKYFYFSRNSKNNIKRVLITKNKNNYNFA